MERVKGKQPQNKTNSEAMKQALMNDEPEQGEGNTGVNNQSPAMGSPPERIAEFNMESLSQGAKLGEKDCLRKGNDRIEKIKEGKLHKDSNVARKLTSYDLNDKRDLIIQEEGNDHGNYSSIEGETGVGGGASVTQVTKGPKHSETMGRPSPISHSPVILIQGPNTETKYDPIHLDQNKRGEDSSNQIRASNWKRRARDPCANQHCSAGIGVELKRKEKHREGDGEPTEDFTWKKRQRLAIDDSGTQINSEAAEADSQPRRTP
ncbi:hypothetical protein U1Q18_008556 [Sarracenia purpurea var. burkii]